MKTKLLLLVALVCFACGKALANPQRIVFAVNPNPTFTVDYDAELCSIKVKVDDGNEVDFTAGMQFPLNADITLTAVPTSKGDFEGWFDDKDKQLSDGQSYNFRNLYNTKLLAKCKEKTVSVTLLAEEPTSNSIKLNGSFVIIGSATGLNPVITINYGEDKTATTTIGADNTFSAEIKDLTPKTEYTFRATFKAGELEGASDEIIKTTPNTFSITTTETAADVTATSAKVGGTLSGEYDGITTYGVEYKKEGDANFEAFPIEDENFTATNTIFAGNLTGLAPGTNYIVRAFATNQYGTDYGETKGFTTLSGEVTGINTALEGNEHATSATVKVTFNYSGIEIDSEKATKRVYYSESAPTADDDINDFPHAEGGEISGDEENGYSFTANLTGLTPNKTYYVIGYFEFRDAEGKSELSEVHTSLGFTVTTADATEVTANSATCGGTIDNTDEQSIIKQGIYYSLNEFSEEILNGYHTTIDSIVIENPTINTISSTVDVSCNTTVYYCAFAKSEHGIAYGEVKHFTTPNALLSFTLEKESDEGPNKVKLKGSFSFCGEAIGTNDRPVTIKYGPEGNKEERTITNYSDEGLGGSAKNFTCELSDLTPNTEYFAQAYFSHGGFEQTSEELTFTTPKAFTVQTKEGTTNLTATSAKVSGQVVKKDTDYSLKDPQCRFYYVAAAEPLTEITAVTDAGTYVDGNLENNSFTGDIEGLTPNTTYYYVACAKEGENDWEYGEVKSFTTNSQAQITSITPITRTNKSAELRVSFTMQGDLPASLVYGVYCSPDQIDDITGLDIKYGSAPTDSVDNIHKYYDVIIDDLTFEKTYYVRPYISEAENFTVIHLNEDQTFTTKTGEVTELKLELEEPIIGNYAKLKGSYVYDGKTIESGDNLIKVYYGEGEKFDTLVVATTITQSNTFTAEISGLEYGKEYYARADFEYGDAKMTSNVERIPIPDGIGEITNVTTIASADSAKVRVQFTYQGKTLDGSAIANVYHTENMVVSTDELTPTQATSIVSDGGNRYHFEVVLTGLEANKEYYAMQEVKIGEVDIDPTDKWQFSEFRTANGEWANHSYIDLGGDVVWATTNLGADSPELEGDLYRWGETTSTAGNIDDNKDEDYSITVTSWEQGDPAYDAAASQWGNGWRMPTIAELALLTDTGVCKSTYDNNNHARVITKSPETSAKLYLPTGTTADNERKGFYYSSSANYQIGGDYEGSRYLYVEGEGSFHAEHYGPGSALRFIRPVLPKAPIVSAVTAVKNANGKYDVSVNVKKTIYDIDSVIFQYIRFNGNLEITEGTLAGENGLYTAEIDLDADAQYVIRALVYYKNNDGDVQPIEGEEMTLNTDPTGSGAGSGN